MQKILSSRIPYIDALRGFAILLVIAGHVIQTLYGTDGLVFRYIYSFHMPLFVFLSGFVSYKIETWKSVGKRFLQLIVPFFCYNVITFFSAGFAGISLRDFVEFNLRVILRPDLGLWFLWVLFFIHTLFICCRKAAKALQIDERIIVLVVLGGLNLVELITRTDFLGFHWIAWYFIFFSAGVYIRPFSQMEHVSLDRDLLIGSAILFPVCAYFFRLQNYITPPLRIMQNIDFGPYFPIFYRLWVAVLGIILFYEIFKRTEAMGASKTLIALGRETLGLYFVHCLIINLTIAPFVDRMGLIPKGGAVVVGIVLTAVSYLIVKFLRRNRLSRLLVLGDYSFCKK